MSRKTVRKETNAKIQESQWEEFDKCWISSGYKEIFQLPCDADSYEDDPNTTPSHHRFWIAIFRNALSEALGFETHAAHREFENMPVKEVLAFFEQRVSIAIGMCGINLIGGCFLLFKINS